LAIDGLDFVNVMDQPLLDETNDRVEKFYPNGDFRAKWGSHGNGPGQFIYAYGIAVDQSGKIFVADTANNRIQKFSSSDGINYTFVTAWGTYGTGNGQFDAPYGIAVDRSGFVYVSDRNNNRIQKFSSTDGINYAFVTKWGAYGTGDGQFDAPYGLAIDGSGLIYVADMLNNRVQAFNSCGVFVAKWGTYGDGDGQFYHPWGIAVDRSGNIFVTEYAGNRVQKFRRKN